jgi:hypothetical protein
MSTVMNAHKNNMSALINMSACLKNHARLSDNSARKQTHTLCVPSVFAVRVRKAGGDNLEESGGVGVRCRSLR